MNHYRDRRRLARRAHTPQVPPAPHAGCPWRRDWSSTRACGPGAPACSCSETFESHDRRSDALVPARVPRAWPPSSARTGDRAFQRSSRLRAHLHDRQCSGRERHRSPIASLIHLRPDQQLSRSEVDVFSEQPLRASWIFLEALLPLVANWARAWKSVQRSGPTIIAKLRRNRAPCTNRCTVSLHAIRRCVQAE